MERMHKNKSKHVDIIGVGLIFVVGVIFHYFCADFSKAIETYPDELRYYTIARNIFRGNGLQIRGIDTSFQKLTYTWVLAPLLSISDSVLRLKIIGLVNSIIMMLSVFPTWLICKELKIERKAMYCVLLLVGIWPDLMLSMTFMSEVVYWPIFLSFVYLWILNTRKQSWRYAVLEGLLCYVGYLTKEIFLALFLAYIAFEVFYPIVSFSIAEAVHNTISLLLLHISMQTFCKISTSF